MLFKIRWLIFSHEIQNKNPILKSGEHDSDFYFDPWIKNTYWTIQKAEIFGKKKVEKFDPE